MSPRALPKDLPPKSTVHGYLTLGAWDGTLQRLHHELQRQTERLFAGEQSRLETSYEIISRTKAEPR